MQYLAIGALIVAMLMLSYLYWESHPNTVFKAPAVEIKRNP